MPLFGRDAQISSASKRLKTAAAVFREDVEDGMAGVEAEETRYGDALATARFAASAAATGRQLARFPANVPLGSVGRWAYGFSGRVVLYEDRIQTPDGTFKLTPEVSCEVDQQGMVQSVQGWTFKGDQDRREAFLSISGGDGGSVIRVNLDRAAGGTSTRWEGSGLGWNSKNRRANTEEMRKFAQAVEIAARQSTSIDEKIAARRKSAEVSLREVLSNRDELEAAVVELEILLEPDTELVDASTALAEAIRDVEVTKQVRHAKQLRDVTGRSVDDVIRQAQDQIARCRDKSRFVAVSEASEQVSLTVASGVAIKGEDGVVRCPNCSAVISGQDERCDECGADIDEVLHADEVAALAAALGQPMTGDPESTPITDATTVSPPETSSLDPIEQLRRLADLRDAGIVTEEEFAAKKADLLSRL